MTDTDDTTASQRVQAWADAIGATPGWQSVIVTRENEADLRTVLREHQDMRERLANIADIADTAARYKPNAIAYIPMYLRQIFEEADISRPVGEWRQADEEQQR